MIDRSENSEIFATNPGLDLLRKSILSLSVTFFGSRHHQNQITAKGYNQYGQVLKQLNHHLAQPELQVTNETLLTAASCMLFEIFLPTAPNNFMKHQRGIEAIMQMRGPPSESENVSATIFRGLRIFSIVGALADSRPSIYTKSEWKRIPPSLMTDSGIIQHQIFDILADCTGLIGKRDKILVSGPTHEQIQSLLEDVEGLLSNLEQLYPQWEILNGKEFARNERISLLAEELGIANHISATVFMLYQTVYMCILQIKESLAPSPINVALRNLAAEKIANCLVFKYQAHRRGVIEANTIGFVATKVAWEALGKFESPEARKLAQAVKATVNTALMRPYGVIRSMAQGGRIIHAQNEREEPGMDFDALFPPLLSSLSMLPIELDGKTAREIHEARNMNMQYQFINIGCTKMQELQEV